MRAMSLRPKPARLFVAALALAGLTGATVMDPANPTCPFEPNWSAYPEMKLTVEKRGHMQVMLVEGWFDAALPGRLNGAVKANHDVLEVWLRSPGRDARAAMAEGSSDEHNSELPPPLRA